MKCEACGRDVSAFPGATVTCACGANVTLPYDPSTDVPVSGPYRTSQTPAQPAVRVPCPFCSFEVDPDLKSCPLCHVDLDLSRCPRCRALSKLGERTCAVCSEALPRATSGDATDAPCPRCAGTLHPIEGEDLAIDALHACDECGGAFLGHKTLAHIAQRHAEGASLPPTLLEHVEPARDEVTYLPCPCCAQRMNRKRVKTMVVDVCKYHGTWFDRGELARVITELPNVPTKPAPALDQAAREALARAQVEAAMDTERTKRQVENILWSLRIRDFFVNWF